jgi:hypothetical protein
MNRSFDAKDHDITDQPYWFTEFVINTIVFYIEQAGVIPDANLTCFR